MKTILIAFLSIFVTHCALCDEPPKPFSITLPSLDADKSEKLTVLVNDLLAHARAADARLNAEDALLKQTEAKETDEVAMVAEVQSKIDKDEALIAKLKAWRLFGRFVLFVIAGVTFAYAWKLTAAVPLPPPHGTLIRVVICIAAGAAVSGLLFYTVTHLL